MSNATNTILTDDLYAEIRGLLMATDADEDAMRVHYGKSIMEQVWARIIGGSKVAKITAGKITGGRAARRLDPDNALINEILCAGWEPMIAKWQEADREGTLLEFLGGRTSSRRRKDKETGETEVKIQPQMSFTAVIPGITFEDESVSIMIRLDSRRPAMKAKAAAKAEEVAKEQEVAETDHILGEE